MSGAGSAPAAALVSRMTGRDTGEAHRVSTPLELLFDLTFVVAVSQAATELVHAEAAGRTWHSITAYLMVFFAVWWAWVNFTWFASAYDVDDVPYRLLTLLQMGGVLVIAAAIPTAFETGRFTYVVVGYVLMRVTMVAQWLRAARQHAAGRRTALRYAGGIAVVQALWVLRLLVPAELGAVTFLVLAGCEMAVPWWAERPRMTPWHPEHIAERYGLFTIIVLGETVSAVARAVQAALSAGGVTGDLVLTGGGGLVLLFACWWLYFLRAPARSFEDSAARTFLWGYLHYLVFAAVAALGGGLEVVTEAVTRGAPAGAAWAGVVPARDGADAFTAGPLTVGLAVGVPAAVFLVVVGVLQATLGGGRAPLALYVGAGVATVAVTAGVAALWAPGTVPAAALPVVAVVAVGLRIPGRRLSGGEALLQLREGGFDARGVAAARTPDERAQG